MKVALSVPSPRRFWSTFGIRRAPRNASAKREFPKYWANTRSRIRPAIRDSRMPAATEAGPRAWVTLRRSPALGVAATRRKGLVLLRAPSFEEFVQESTLFVEPLELARQPLHLAFERGHSLG